VRPFDLSGRLAGDYDSARIWPDPVRGLSRLGSGGSGSTIRLVTAKERLLERAPDWTEEQAVRALRAVEGDSSVDEWGDLAAVHDMSTAKTMRRLAAEEQAAGREPW
jgi:hypothetical protein